MLAKIRLMGAYIGSDVTIPGEHYLMKSQLSEGIAIQAGLKLNLCNKIFLSVLCLHPWKTYFL